MRPPNALWKTQSFGQTSIQPDTKFKLDSLLAGLQNHQLLTPTQQTVSSLPENHATGQLMSDLQQLIKHLQQYERNEQISSSIVPKGPLNHTALADTFSKSVLLCRLH